MSATNQTYMIKNVTDLTQLDERQLDACLKDLKTWVQFHKKAQGLAAHVIKTARDMGMKVSASDVGIELQDHMAWIDDGIDGGELNIVVKDSDGTVHASEKFKV